MLAPLLRLSLLLTLAAAMVGCQRNAYHDLEVVATAPLNAAEQQACQKELAPVTPHIRTPAVLFAAIDILDKANAAAPGSALARAQQAVIVDRVVRGDGCETRVRWLDDAPSALRTNLLTIFTQADAQLRTGRADLLAVMVWARIGSGLNLGEQLQPALTAAMTDDRLRRLLREDSSTQRLLLQYHQELAENVWTAESIRMLNEPRTATPGETLADVAGTIAFIPFFPVYLILVRLIGNG